MNTLEYQRILNGLAKIEELERRVAALEGFMAEINAPQTIPPPIQPLKRRGRPPKIKQISA